MATNNGGKGRRRKTSRKQNDSRWTNSAKDKPLAAAIGAAAAVGAGIFLWSRRNQISDQIGSLAEQVREVREAGGWRSDGSADGTAERSSAPGDGRSQREIAEEALTLKEIGAAPETSQPLG
jgi:hypothetical protein